MVFFVATYPSDVRGFSTGDALHRFADGRFHFVVVMAAFAKRERFPYGIDVESLIAEEFDQVDSVACACGKSKRKGPAHAQEIHRAENSRILPSKHPV